VQNYINFWDQHGSTWHPHLNKPPAPIHPSAQLFNTLQDTKKELAEMLNCLQRHTCCVPGYCEHKKKLLVKYFAGLVIQNNAESKQNCLKIPEENFQNLTLVKMIPFSTLITLHLFWGGGQI
jgi:hypothetical protein